MKQLSNKTLKFKMLDIVYIVMMVLPIAFCIVLQILTKPVSEGINITGVRIFFEIPMP